MTRSVCLAIDELEVRYNTTSALRVPHLRIQGSTIAVIGHNGAGKSTLLKSILGLSQIINGQIRISSISDCGSASPLLPDQDMSFCPESGAVFMDISVRSYIKLWCRIKVGDPSYYENDGFTYIKRLGIAHLLDRLGRELSKGERRRVQTAIGFLSKPHLFLFDEPFDGLDIVGAEELAELIREESINTSFVISSHRIDILDSLADAAIVLSHGEIIAAGQNAFVCNKLNQLAHNPDNSATSLASALRGYLAHNIKDLATYPTG